MTRTPSWDDLFVDPHFHWTQPDEGVVASAPRWRGEGREIIYDLGCGAGRHMAWLQTEGFDVFGSDVSPNGLAACSNYLRDAGLSAPLVMADMTSVPFADESFDAAISTNVLNHNPRALLQRAVDEVWRTLRAGGEFFLTVLNHEDWRYGSGEEVEPDTFVLADGAEAGILHHFFSQEDVRQWLAAFEVLEIERKSGSMTDTTRADGRPVHRDGWAVLVRKP